MAIPLPNLDDRRWSDLVEQGRALIPLYAPEWTDHNASDPGITLMELLAWIAETDVFQLNRLTDRQKHRLLQLMDIRPSPPQPATVVVGLRVVAGAGPVSLPESLDFAGARLDGAAALLKSTGPIDVAPAALRAIQRREASGFQDLTAAWTRNEAIALFGEYPRPGAEFYLGFDWPLPVGAWTQLYFFIHGALAGLEERRRIQAETGADGALRHHDARVAWDYLADVGGSARWLPLDAQDGTRVFTLSGAVRLRPRQPMKPTALGPVSESLCYLRCRFVQGAFDEAPRAARVLANGLELVQSVPVWQSWTLARGAVVSGPFTPGQATGLQLKMQGGEISELSVDDDPDAPRFMVLGYVAPTAGASGLLTVQASLAGAGSGEPGQVITLARSPLVESTLRFFSLEGTRWRPWMRVDDLAAAKRADAQVLLDPTRGELRFGDGEHGRVAPAGCLLFAFYESTLPAPAMAGVSGIADTPRNRVLLADPGAIGRIAAGPPIELEAARPAETLGHAIGRAIESREARLRAVTVEDFEALARETPGLRVARAIARPNLYPGLPCVSAAGVVSVIVLPSLPASRPSPSAGLIQAVAARLDRRRMIGTRVVVSAPRYLEVAVRARLRAFEGKDKARLSTAVAAAIDAFFHPLTGGPDKTGWPLGRDVYRAELMQVIDETPGVDHVLSLELVAQGCEPSCGNVCLQPTWLVAAGSHEIEVQ
ncbi:putative baseplate assembly protein [Variovorax sp. RA8]|uniref:putative baseplate assembly protein n=1 Tax=Variovorax sp. (strain JCM 16519 / RA8) TaxID=662548 RepID=UPI001319831D|nr:putative baseplate assembly protein [Variovorax sp. RA8]VTU28790.1 Baseplate J-like protein [Variovorax sp. RA8]